MALVRLCLLSIGCLAAAAAAVDSELINKLQGVREEQAASPKPLQTHLADHPACQKDLAALATR